MIRLIASDMDGTLLSDGMEISKENISAIKKAQAAGIRFMVATGRSIEEAKPILDAAGIRCGLITSNGAQIFDEMGQAIYTLGIEKANLDLALPILRHHQVYFELFTDHGGFTENNAYRLSSVANWLKSISPNLTEDQALEIAKEHMSTLPITEVASFDQVLENPDRQVLKIFAIGQIGDTALASAKAELSDLANLTVTSSGANNIEVNHEAAQKGVTLKKVADNLNIPMSQVATLGDNFNDLSMIEAAGLGIAMGNAEPEIQAVAQYTTKTNVAHGVSYAIEQILSGVWG